MDILDNTLIMTDEDKERWIPSLFKYYCNKGLEPALATKAIEKVFAQCQIGWNRCPRNLDTRIKMKSGFQWKSHANLKPRRKIIEKEPVESVEEMDENYLFSSMNKGEKEWWDNRYKEYKGDFDFNESSDKPLVEQVLVEELFQRRLFKKQLQNSNQDFSKRLTEGLKRIADAQTKLGITREQRAGILNKIDGNVAQIALDLDEKLSKMPEIEKKQLEEELYYESLKAQKDPLNLLPPIEKVEALLNVGGKTSADLSSSQISNITEQVAKEITEKNEAKAEEITRKELPDGIDVSV